MKRPAWMQTIRVVKRSVTLWWLIEKRVRVACLVGVSLVFLGTSAATAEGVDHAAVIKQVAAALKSGDLDSAIQDAVKLDDAAKTERLSDVDVVPVLAQVARALEQSRNREKHKLQATQLYQRAIAANKRTASTTLSPKQLALIHMAAGSNLVRAGKNESAISSLETALELSDQLLQRQRQNVCQLLILLGSDSLADQKAVLAARAYRMAVDHASAKSRATAQLGLGWSLAMQKDQQSEAADALTDFVRANPNHADVPRAIDLCVGCLKKAGREADASEMASRLLVRHSGSLVAANFVRKFHDVPLSEVPASVRTWLMSRGSKERVDSLDGMNAVLAITVATDDKQPELADRLASSLAPRDETGQYTSATLQRLANAGFDADAQRIAGSLLTVENTGDTKEQTAAAREAACRWLGRQEHWAMLAMASESSKPEVVEKSRSVGVERLFAEALMQVGRQADAKVWWEHLVDTREEIDFLTLLRCAETATALADVGVATKRIEAARLAAGSDVNQFSLVEMLSSELDVRELKFDSARRKLQQVVESENAIATLRARAQWTIGETFYMQQKFADAIEAYRMVETVDPGGNWIAVSLVQAGKSFEQLGRTREATVCYSTLISRFAESPYAPAARRRMAALDPDTSSTDDTIRR